MNFATGQVTFNVINGQGKAHISSVNGNFTVSELQALEDYFIANGCGMDVTGLTYVTVEVAYDHGRFYTPTNSNDTLAYMPENWHMHIVSYMITEEFYVRIREKYSTQST